MAKIKDENSSDTRRRRWKWINSAIAVALVGVLGGIITTILSKTLPDGGAPDSTVRLELDNVSVGTNTLDFQLRNTGNQIAIITGVRLNIVNLTKDCKAHENLPPSAIYGIKLPLQAGRSVNANVHDSVGPNNADRFDVRIALPFDAQADALYVYQLHISISYDKNNVLNAGNHVVELRAAPFDLGEQRACS
jgi:hypothetical protein